jgi:type II secretory pathway pseudopilin PulG
MHWDTFEKKRQSGQTIIEVIIAVAMMTLGVGAAVSLASYSLHASGGISKQLIGTGLAREGLEALRNMRDTNWLKGTLSDPAVNTPGCYDYKSGSQDAACYHDWLSSYYTLESGSYVLDMDPSSGDGTKFWKLVPENNEFRLKFDQDATKTGRVYPAITTESLPYSQYKRRIIIQEETPGYAASPSDIGPRLRIISMVWWEDQNCPPTNTFPEKGGCGVKLESFLTNWRNY